VTVDEAREDGQPRSVDLLRVGGYRYRVSSTGRLDMSAFDEDDGFTNCFAGRRIQQAVGMKSSEHMSIVALEAPVRLATASFDR